MLQPIRLMRSPDAEGGGIIDKLGGVAGVAGLAGGLITTIGGFIGKNRQQRAMANLMAQRKAYMTPDEIFKIEQATQANAATGLGGDVLSYLTGNADKAFSASIGASTRLGGNPNDLAAIFDRRVNEGFKIGGESQSQKQANFAKFLSSLSLVADNKTAEWQSKDNILKDQIQAVAAAGGDANKTMQGGINSILGTLSAAQMMGLYPNNNTGAPLNIGSSVVTPAATNPATKAFDKIGKL
jgi:hypothetical protein